MITFNFNTPESYLLISLGILWLIQLIYYFALYKKIPGRNSAARKGKIKFSEEYPPLSVVVCTRDECEKLRDFLPLILEQDYPDFEVIVVNDHPKDESEDLLICMQEKYQNLHYTFIPDSARYVSRKKLALTLGIKASKNDWVVFTDAHCYPVSKNWLRLLARNFVPGIEVVLGYSSFKFAKGWLHKRMAFDMLFTSMRYLGFALAGNPYMGVGRNMAYRRELFFKKKGFSSHLNLQRGDDDLFINQVATKKNTRVETDIDSTVRMQPLHLYKDWMEEKMSYMVTSRYFKGPQRFILGFETFSRFLFYLVTIATMVMAILHMNWIIAGITLLLWLFRFVVQAYIINKTSRELGDKRSYYFSIPVFDILIPLLNFKINLYRMYMGEKNYVRR